MKLLTPQVLKDGRASEQAREALRIKEMNEASDKARKQLANAQAEFNLILSQNRVRWANEEEEHGKRLSQMIKEIDILEAKKVQALIPIEMYKKEADELFNEAQKTLDQAKEKETKADELTERFQDKLDELGAREQDIIKVEQKLSLQQQGILIQQEQTKTGIKQLNKTIEEFTVTKQNEEKELADKKVNLILLERTLIAKEETLKQTEQSLNSLARQLEDRRATLERAFKRLSP